MYGTKTQYTDTDTAELEDAQSTLYVQKFCGTFLYYAIAIDQTWLVALNTIATAQSHATTTTNFDIVWLLNYAATHPDATIQYHYSDMILHVASDASYLCKKRACSQARGHFPLADQLIKNGDKPPPLPTNNGAMVLRATNHQF